MKNIACLILAVTSVITVISILLYKVFLKTDICKFPSKSPEEERKWLKKVKYDELYINSYDKMILHAYSVKQNSDKWVIICHGYDSEGQNMACYGEKFYEIGYNVLLPDQRGYGLSEGNKTTMGVKEEIDLQKWIDKLNFEYKPKEIVLFGVSMGAATVMLAAGNKLSSNVKAVIEDCGYTSVYEEFKYNLRKMFRLPGFPFLNVVDIITRIYDWSILKNGSCIKAVKYSRLPILFIHGSADDFVPFYMHDELYNEAKCKKQKLVVYGASHAESYSKDPELYWKTISEFIKEL